MIKTILLLLPLAAVVIASGSDLPDDQVEEVLALYRRHCASSYGQSSSLGNNVNIICKEGREDHEPPKKQIIKIPPGPQPKKNILFVEAPTYKFKHDITVVGNDQQAPRTVVYVLPSKNTHNYDVQDGRFGNTNAEKPQVFFLKNNHADGGTSVSPSKPPPVYGPPVQATKPPPVYGPPVQGTKPPPVYGPPVEATKPPPVYGPPVQATNPPPVYGPPSQSSKPSTGYGVPVHTSKPSSGYGAPAQPSPGYGVPSNPWKPSSGYDTPAQPSKPSSGYGGPSQHTESVGNLGPQYEVVQQPPQSSHAFNGYQAISMPVEAPPTNVFYIANMDNQGYRSIESGYTQIPTEPDQDQQPILIQQLESPKITPLGYGNGIGKIIFPSESMESIQYSPLQFARVQHNMDYTPQQPLIHIEPQQEVVQQTVSVQSEESPPANVLSYVPKNLFKRKLTSPSSKIIFLDEDSKPRNNKIAYNDYYNYMDNGSVEVETPKMDYELLKSPESSRSNENENPSRENKPSSTIQSPEKDPLSIIMDENKDMDPFHLRLLMALAASKAKSELKTMNRLQAERHSFIPVSMLHRVTEEEASTSNNNNNNNNNNRVSVPYRLSRRSSEVPERGFEFIPANFVSYSYSKSDIGKENDNGPSR